MTLTIFVATNAKIFKMMTSVHNCVRDIRDFYLISVALAGKYLSHTGLIEEGKESTMYYSQLATFALFTLPRNGKIKDR